MPELTSLSVFRSWPVNNHFVLQGDSSRMGNFVRDMEYVVGHPVGDWPDDIQRIVRGEWRGAGTLVRYMRFLIGYGVPMATVIQYWEGFHGAAGVMEEIADVLEGMHHSGWSFTRVGGRRGRHDRLVDEEQTFSDEDPSDGEEEELRDYVEGGFEPYQLPSVTGPQLITVDEQEMYAAGVSEGDPLAAGPEGYEEDWVDPDDPPSYWGAEADELVESNWGIENEEPPPEYDDEDDEVYKYTHKPPPYRWRDQ